MAIGGTPDSGISARKYPNMNHYRTSCIFQPTRKRRKETLEHGRFARSMRMLTRKPLYTRNALRSRTSCKPGMNKLREHVPAGDLSQERCLGFKAYQGHVHDIDTFQLERNSHQHREGSVFKKGRHEKEHSKQEDDANAMRAFQAIALFSCGDRCHHSFSPSRLSLSPAISLTHSLPLIA